MYSQLEYRNMLIFVFILYLEILMHTLTSSISLLLCMQTIISLQTGTVYSFLSDVCLCCFLMSLTEVEWLLSESSLSCQGVFLCTFGQREKAFLGAFLVCTCSCFQVSSFQVDITSCRMYETKKKKKEIKKEKKKPPREYVTVFFGVLCPQLACLILAHFHSLLMFNLYIISGF